ncbi:uncharacterized protein LOC143585802 [Bidens hawaiensis]|uniref:uncharacterized protein LOC143585802 n=1 Tax=Bidens hawaiensis TaxID=980011 RepID=UPI004049E87C
MGLSRMKAYRAKKEAEAQLRQKLFNSWEWFLENLGDDLDLHINSNFTFISDRQKGIITAITKLFPCAEHRYCLRHIHQNMKLQWRGKAYMDMLYSIAMATTVQEYQSKMQELKYANAAAYQWLNNIPPAHWARSHFTVHLHIYCAPGRAKSDVLLNNMCEVFNSKLVDGRDKPINSARICKRMKRIVNVTKVIGKSHGILTPAISKKLEVIKKEASKLTVKWNGGSKFQVAGYMGEQCVVDVAAPTCSCRRWELTGIPCKHAVASNWDMSLNGLDVEIPEKSTCPTKLKEPKHHKPIGRPKKKRKKDATEKEDEMVKGGKLSKKLRTTTCGTCGNRGHNRRSCTGQGEASSSASLSHVTISSILVF